MENERKAFFTNRSRKLKLDIYERTIATCLVSVRLILSSFWPIAQRKPPLDRISRFLAVESSTDFSIFVSTLGHTNLWFFDLYCRLHNKTYIYANFQVCSTSGSTL